MKIVEAYIHTGSLKNKGITLIALVITIIILLILAGITIIQITGNGLFGKTEIAKQKTRYVAAKETVNLKLMEIQVDCTEKDEKYNIKKIAEGMKLAEDITIEKYYNKGTGSIKDGVTENLTDLEGIVVSVDEYSEYKFLIGEKCEIEGVLEGEVTDTTKIEEFENIEEFEKKAFVSESVTDTIKFSYEKIAIVSNKIQILITIKDEENGLNKIEYPDGDILNCNGKKQIGIDYIIECGVEYVFKITSNNGYVKEVKIYEEKQPKNVLVISGKEYTFTCIDTNYQGYHLYLCDELIPYNICGPNTSITYQESALRTWLNNNAPEEAVNITLEDTGTTEKMFILSKEENERYKEHTEITWSGNTLDGNKCCWLRTYYGSSQCNYVWDSDGGYYPLDVANTGWAGCRPVYALNY